MNLFFVFGGIILIILAALLLYTSVRIPKDARTPTYLSLALCLIIGVIALYLGLN